MQQENMNVKKINPKNLQFHFEISSCKSGMMTNTASFAWFTSTLKRFTFIQILDHKLQEGGNCDVKRLLTLNTPLNSDAFCT